MLLNFSDQTRTGVFNVVWPLARKEHENEIDKQNGLHRCLSAKLCQCPKMIVLRLDSDGMGVTIQSNLRLRLG